jgi:hypothetical protein
MKKISKIFNWLFYDKKIDEINQINEQLRESFNLRFATMEIRDKWNKLQKRKQQIKKLRHRRRYYS